MRGDRERRLLAVDTLTYYLIICSSLIVIIIFVIAVVVVVVIVFTGYELGKRHRSRTRR